MALYEVNDGGKPRLVHAANRAQARSYVAERSITVSIPSATRVHVLSGRGVVLEYASDALREAAPEAPSE